MTTGDENGKETTSATTDDEAIKKAIEQETSEVSTETSVTETKKDEPASISVRTPSP